MRRDLWLFVRASYMRWFAGDRRRGRDSRDLTTLTTCRGSNSSVSILPTPTASSNRYLSADRSLAGSYGLVCVLNLPAHALEFVRLYKIPCCTLAAAGLAA